MTSNRNNEKRLSYLEDLKEFDENSSEDDEKKDEKPKIKEEIYGWDLFRYFPQKTKTGSSADISFYLNCLKACKVFTYFVLFCLVLGGGVLAKAIVLLAAAQVDPRAPTAYCDYDERLGRGRQTNLQVQLSQEGKISWYWCIILAFFVPEVITLINTVFHLFFKKKKIPRFLDGFFVCFVETLHAAAMAVLFLIVIPGMDSLPAAAVTTCTCFIPAVLGLLSRTKIPDSSSKLFALLMFGDIVAVIAQISGILALILVRNIDETVKWLLPGVLILSSIRWWPNYVSPRSRIGMIRSLFNLKTRLEPCRGTFQGVTALLRIAVFSSVSLIIINFKGIDIADFFNNFPGQQRFNVCLHQESIPADSLECSVTNKQLHISANSYVPLMFFAVHGVAAFITYFSAKCASRTLMQHLGFAFPVSLTVPATIVTIFLLSIFREEDSCQFHSFLPDYIFYSSSEGPSSASSLILHWEQWLWIPWLLSQAWVTMHIWTPHCERLATTEKLFAVPSYDSLIIDQSLMLNRRKDDAPEETAEVKVNDRVTKVYACATLWHEGEDEMTKFVNSVLRLDRYQSAHRFTQNWYKVQIDDYYELETHVFFDDAFQCSHGCEETCEHDENDTQVNSYVKTLIKVMENCVTRTRMLATPPMKFPAPYGGRLEWILPGKTTFTVHLKDKNKIRHRKRWSQVMYMYYLLGHRLMDRPLSIDRKAAMAENTYILTLDGDIDFNPEALIVLLHLMKKDRELGAACGRIHPMGSGPMVWYQKFEYAIGHWLQKSTEHVIGSVLCSPGCFSLFRAKTLMEDNVMRKYALKSTEPRHYVQYDQGEDRWLCTLILQSGGKVEYCAASDSYTHAPETFNEFYNQRRRWIPSTLANILDLLSTAKETRQVNENISFPYILYQWILMGSTVLGPGTIFLMLVGAFVTAFRIDNWSSFGYNLIPLAIFVGVCFFFDAKVQLFTAATISAIYGLVMVVVLVGIMIQITEDGWVAPSSILFLVVAIQLILAGLLHPQEWLCLVCGLIYYITVPSMYMLLIIFSLFNLNNVTWGTRDSKPTIAPKSANANQNQNEIPAKTQEAAPKQANVKTSGAVDFSLAGLFRCILCTNNDVSPVDKKLELIGDTLHRITTRLDEMEKKEIIETQPMKVSAPLEPEKIEDFANEPDEEAEVLSNCPSEEEAEDENRDRTGNFLVAPQWIRDKDISRGGVEFLSYEEEVFWKRLIKKYLYPLDEDLKQLAKTADELKSLRNEYLFKFFMINSLFVLIVFLMQMNKDILHLEWPLGKTYNVTYNEKTQQVLVEKEYLQLEPIGCLFIIGFVCLLGVQFMAMLVHRFNTLCHVLANTALEFKRWCKSKDGPEEISLESHAKEMAKGLQRLAEETAHHKLSERPSESGPAKKRNTVHALIAEENRTQLPSDFDSVFRQNLRNPAASARLTSIGISTGVLKALEKRRTTVVHQRQSQFKRNISNNGYQEADNGVQKSHYNQIPTGNAHTYDNPVFISDDPEEEKRLSAHRDN